MKKRKLLLGLSLILVNYICISQPKKINGISFVASSQKLIQQNIDPIKKASANYVALMPFGFIRDLSNPKIIYNSKRQWFGETTEGVRQYANEFKKQGIKLMIKPQIWVWHGKYTGDIKMTTEEDWKKLEESYTQFILAYVSLAKELNAEIFCIGTELEDFIINRPDYWLTLIEKVKKVYNGKLTYAANWDEFKRTPFWNKLDYIGIDAYFPISDKKKPSVYEFEKGWKIHKDAIKKISTKFDIPVLFTEYGYRSIDYTGKEPWKSDRVTGNINLENQKNALQALYNQFWKEDWFAGGFLWKWFQNHTGSGGIDNNRFTPQNKPAEKLIKEIYAN